MESFTDTLVDLIMTKEKPRLTNIMQYIAKNVQKDLIGVTRAVIDAYYQDYNPEYYIRTDDYKAQHLHPINKKNGQFRPKNRTEWNRSKDKSLRSAIQALTEGDQPAMGICRPLDGIFGYQAGVLFDPNKFKSTMHHEHKGFTEWDITENFLFGQHGNGEAIHFTEPHADIVLRNYIDSYKTKFDRHYNDACRKFM